MSAIKDVIFDIQESIIDGQLSFAEIAAANGLTVQDVELIAEELNDMIEGEREMDVRDWDGEALASVGWGVDEDYVYDNDYFD